MEIIVRKTEITDKDGNPLFEVGFMAGPTYYSLLMPEQAMLEMQTKLAEKIDNLLIPVEHE